MAKPTKTPPKTPTTKTDPADEGKVKAEAAKAEAKAAADKEKADAAAKAKADKEAAAKAKAEAKVKADAEKAAAKAAADAAKAVAKATAQKLADEAKKLADEAKEKAKAAREAARAAGAGGGGRGTDALRNAAPNYHRDTEKKTAGGNVSVDSDDDVAQKLRGKSLDDVYTVAFATISKADPEAFKTLKDLKAKYGHLNVGMQRMNLGNRMRAILNAK